jgi:UDP-N-acetylmuramate dehydrogenase
MSLKGNNIKVSAGVLMDGLVAFATQNSLSSFEWAGGLPGTVGGAIRGNAGAFKGETKDNLIEVRSLNIDTLEIITRNNKECKFDYRQSVFKKGEGEREIILEATFEMKKGNREKIKNDTQEKIDYRIDRHPLNYPNIGSTFKNVPVEKVPDDVLKKFEKNIKQDPFPVVPVAKLIVSLDLIGKKSGNAQISTKHPNFIVNLGNAKAADVLSLIQLVKKEVKNVYNITLEEEIMIV